MGPRTRNLLLVAPSWLGDAVMSLPLLGYLAACEGVRVCVMCSGYTARVFWGLDEVDQLVVLSKSGWARRFWHRSRTLRAIVLSGGVVLPPSFSSALALYLAGIRHRIGFRTDGRGMLLTRGLTTRGLRETHLSESYLGFGRELVDAMGMQQPHGYDTPSVRVFDQDRESTAKIVGKRLGTNSGYVVVVPGATFGPTKSWPREKYRALVTMMAKDVPVVLVGSATEREMCDWISHDIAGACNIAGETDLGTLFGVLESALAIVANDSGVPHAAASIGVPVVVIFGSTSPTWTRPLGDHVDVVCEPVHCSPCFRRECPTQLECYAAISPEMVWDRVERAAGTRGSSVRGNVSNT